jgi:hypothetical protein
MVGVVGRDSVEAVTVSECVMPSTSVIDTLHVRGTTRMITHFFALLSPLRTTGIPINGRLMRIEMASLGSAVSGQQ